MITIPALPRRLDLSLVYIRRQRAQALLVLSCRLPIRINLRPR